MMYRDFVDAGLRVFALWAVRDGVCDCGDPECMVPGKHPRASNWQHTPEWSEDQLEVMEEMDQFETGYGVLTEGLLVVDVDERNGGAESYVKLLEKLPQIAGAGLIVRTGSGGESKHLYFAMPEPVPMVQHLDQYPGIDFKSSGYVVGPDSFHASGGRYEVLTGSPFDIESAPSALVDLLRKPERHRASVNGAPVDVSEDDIESMLESIPNDEGTDYEVWIRIGMAIHLVTGGDGFHLWEQWSEKGPKHNPKDMGKKWHSFGKSANPVTFGTLAHYAEEAGWIAPVEFTSDVHFELPEEGGIEVEGIDLLRPPGFAGKLAAWINSRNRHPREYLATAAALATISSVAGMRYQDPLDGITPNVFLFGVSGSATGKESILKSHQELLRAAGVSSAAHGGFKSEQEIFRNLTRHQCALYVIDELGETLGKIQNARTKGSASYLEGIVGSLMSLYSKANSFAMVTGDLKEEIKKAMMAEYAGIQKRIDGNEGTERDEIRLHNIKRQLDHIDSGITPNVFLFGVSGSATGKESILKSHQELLRAAGVSSAAHGGFKSEQEIFRNLTRHQCALYVIDELGETLGKIQNARTKGSASYLEGIVGSLMSLYSKANSFAMVTGDLKEEIKKAMMAEYAGIQKRIDGNEGTERDEIRLHNIKRQLDHIDSGIERPYLNIFGLTTPERFNDLMDFDMAANGFMGRSLIFREREDNPKSKPRGKVRRGAVPNEIAATLQQLYAPGHSEVPERVERIGEPVDIATRPDAEALLDEAEQAFYEMAEKAKNSTGLTAIPRRGYEQVAKVSMILAIPEGLRTAEHVRWAYALVKRDVEEKINLAYSNSAVDKQDALASQIMSNVSEEHGETIGRLRSKCRKYRKEDVDKTVEKLVDAGHLKEEEAPNGKGRTTVKYFAVIS